MDDQQETNRRPLAVRDISLTRKIAVYLSQKSISPNQISIMSVVFALMGLLVCAAYALYPNPLLLLLFAITIQMRLLCNLFDGMVAVEGGKKTPAGELFNDVPDRLADPIIILGAGLLTHSQFGMTLAWIAALLAVLTAYIRVLGVSMGCPADFRGPMAKQHRMALLTGSSLTLMLLTWSEILPSLSQYLFDFALMIMAVGCVVTCWRRLQSIFRFKQNLVNEESLGNRKEPKHG